MNTIVFFNNRAGIGKTSLVYHLAWMYADLGINVIAADLDPQAHLSSMFLDEDRLEELWEGDGRQRTVYGALRPILEGNGDIAKPYIETIDDSLNLIIGDLALSLIEEELHRQWQDCLSQKPQAFRVISAFWRILKDAAAQTEANLVLIDLGPNLGAINRTALICAHHIVIPLSPDLYSVHGLKNLGPTLRRWREEWNERKQLNPLPNLSLPPGIMNPAGYLILQDAIRLDQPVQKYDRWISQIPAVYRKAVLGETSPSLPPDIEKDVHCLTLLKHYPSLVPLAKEARKPMFKLTPADGAIGGHAKAVQQCYYDFKELAQQIARKCGVTIP